MFDSTRDYTPPGRTFEKRRSGRDTAKLVIQTLVFAVIGRQLARYFGLFALVPMIALVVVHVVAQLTKRGSARFIHAIAFQVAHVSWMTAGALLSREYIYLADPVILGALLTWLIIRPGRLPVIFLGAFNLLAMAHNIFQVLTSSAPSLERELQLHILLELAVVAALVYGLFRPNPKSTSLDDTQGNGAQSAPPEPPADVLPKP